MTSIARDGWTGEIASHPEPSAAERAAFAKQPAWMPRMWQGCDFFAWLTLLSRNRCAVHPRLWYIALIITITSVINTVLGVLESAIFGRAVRSTAIAQPPIFLLGHWRNGTTLLHELMACDARFACPTTYQCLEPSHFLLTERLLSRWLRCLMPDSRPMDNMKAGFDRPQEDEFAMCMLGAGSPYAQIAFPNRPLGAPDVLDLEAAPPAIKRRWKRTFYWFLQKLTYKTGRRLVLKSPPHTARIKTLLEMFPDAIFIHIVRDPYAVFPSTVNLWRTLYATHGLQIPTNEGIEETVLRTFVRMHEKLEEGRALLRQDQFYELTYEDLVKNPAEAMRAIYRHFGLGGFEACLPKLREHLAGLTSYQRNAYRLSDAQRNLVTRCWGDIIRRYGYPLRHASRPMTADGHLTPL